VGGLRTATGQPSATSRRRDRDETVKDLVDYQIIESSLRNFSGSFDIPVITVIFLEEPDGLAPRVRANTAALVSM
jgi:hypothetical protein